VLLAPAAHATNVVHPHGAAAASGFEPFDNFCASRTNGDYQVPGNPCGGQFLKCSDHLEYIFDCQPGLVFNPNNDECDYRDNVAECRGTVPTELPPVTTTQETRLPPRTTTERTKLPPQTTTDETRQPPETTQRTDPPPPPSTTKQTRQPSTTTPKAKPTTMAPGCTGRVCSQLTTGCSKNPNCYCYKTSDGKGFCGTSAPPYCADLPDCTSCPLSTSVCVIDSCCGKPICYPRSYGATCSHPLTLESKEPSSFNRSACSHDQECGLGATCKLHLTGSSCV